jgi:hypothetical protein
LDILNFLTNSFCLWFSVGKVSTDMFKFTDSFFGHVSCTNVFKEGCIHFCYYIVISSI